MERLQDFFPYFIATGANRRSQRGEQPRRFRAKEATHLAHRFFDDARQQATPSSVDNGDRAALRVHQHNR
jgi:hypothetical protein